MLLVMAVTVAVVVVVRRGSRRRSSSGRSMHGSIVWLSELACMDLTETEG